MIQWGKFWVLPARPKGISTFFTCWDLKDPDPHSFLHDKITGKKKKEKKNETKIKHKLDVEVLPSE